LLEIQEVSELLVIIPRKPTKNNNTSYTTFQEAFKAPLRPPCPFYNFCIYCKTFQNLSKH
jgi:hypothetical protein